MNGQNSNNAVASGNWDKCAVWNGTATIYNTSDDYKIIHPGIVVTLNLTNVYAKKITFLGSGKITLGTNKISFTGSGSSIISIPACTSNYLDNVFVNFSEPVVAKSLSGFLHSLGTYNDNIGTGNELLDPLSPVNSQRNSVITPLQPKLFRIADINKYDRAYSLAGRVQIVLSDRWTFPIIGPIRPNPSLNSNWCDYTEYLNNCFSFAKTVDGIRPGIVWECWNEPNLPQFGFSNRLDFFETYAVFYNTIKASPLALNGNSDNEDSSPQVSGPSISRFDIGYLNDFFEFCLRRNLQVNNVTWHELLNDSEYRPIVKLKENVEYIRNHYMNNPRFASLKMKTITVSEIVPFQERANPVIQAAHLGYLEQAEVDFACKSCWQDNVNDVGSCFDNRFNNLFTKSNEKTAIYHTYKLYADGVSTRVKSFNESGKSIVIASSSNADLKKQILFGYSDYLFQPPPIPTGRYKFRLNNIGPSGSTRTIIIKEIAYSGIDAPDNGANTPLPNLPNTNFFTTSVIIDSYQGCTIDIPNIKKENLYQMTIN